MTKQTDKSVCFLRGIDLIEDKKITPVGNTGMPM